MIIIICFVNTTIALILFGRGEEGWGAQAGELSGAVVAYPTFEPY